jgi:gamma-glutamyltranspeptidase/glutathione hydrolase
MLEYPASMDFNSRRSPVVAKHGIVATSQPLAAAAGLEVLRQGGNAADAAVATAAALNVTEPTSTGLGGDCFALFYDARSRKVHVLNGSGRAPAALTLEKVTADGFSNGIPDFHPHTITVPGAAAGWIDLVEKLGTLSLEQVLAPAVKLAEEGFPVAPITAYYWNRGVDHQLKQAPNGLELTINGRAPQPGEIFRNPGLAKTIKALASGGKQAFYQGEIAAAIVKVVQDTGGVMTLEDLAEHTSTWDTPISTTYRNFRVWECPPNGQGLAALLALNILEQLEMDAMEPFSTQRLHLQIEAMRLAFADTRWYTADPAVNPAPLDELLSNEYAAERAKLIDPTKATLNQQHGTPTSSSDTVYLTVVDRSGNACSFINSNYMGFGTGFVPKGFGFTLQNRGAGFSLVKAHPNALAPRKRPYHTIIPAIITHADSGELYASYGVMGGFMQPQGHMQVASFLIDHGDDPQVALDRPRFCIADGTAGGKIALEEGIPVKTMTALAQIGHEIVPTSGHERAIFGRGQVILRDRVSGVLWGGSDPRADGQALGLI